MREFPVYQVISVDLLVPYARNSRTHSDQQITRIAASIKEFGFLNPIIVDGDNGIVAGHGRVLAAKKLGMTELPCVEASHLTAAQRKAYIIADNRLALDAGWDEELLRLEFDELEDMGFDLELTGFTMDEINALDPEQVEGLTDEDAVPEAPEDPVTVLGDVWLCGSHRVMCGDSTSIEAVDKLMDGRKADFCFTSPPYGQQREYKKAIDDWDAMMNGVYAALPVKDGAQVLVNLGLIHSNKEWQPYWDKWIDFMRSAGWLRFGLYVWDQCPGMMGDHQGRLAPSFELIFHFCKENKRAHKTATSKHGGRYIKLGSKGQRGKDGVVKQLHGVGKTSSTTKVRDGVIRVSRNLSSPKAGGHPAPFPVELCKELSLPWVKRGDICFEPFTGSGTQIINCEKEGFVFHGMELAPAYVDIAVKRWQNFTGKEATHEETGKTFAELSNGR